MLLPKLEIVVMGEDFKSGLEFFHKILKNQVEQKILRPSKSIHALLKIQNGLRNLCILPISVKVKKNWNIFLRSDKKELKLCSH